MKRNTRIDLIRGFALLGILIINIQAFGMISAAYNNPVLPGASGLDIWIWSINHVLADQKFMAIFSMLFGVSLLIFTDKAESRGANALGLFYRRLFWLLLFGLLHAYLLWHGDILFTYAICGAAVVLFRGRSARWLFAGAGLLLILGACSILAQHSLLPVFAPEEIEYLNSQMNPPPAQVAEETRIFRSGWSEQMLLRVPYAFNLQTEILIFWSLPRVMGMMMLGMALYRSGFFDGGLTSRRLQAIGIGISCTGFALAGIGLYRHFAHGWQGEYSLLAGSLFNYWGSVLAGLGMMACLLFLPTGGLFAPVARALEAIGRTAFSNYIFQSVAASLLFYGHGLALFGRLSRAEQWGLVLLIWCAQVILTSLWLRFHTTGPLEWCWRRLTYGTNPIAEAAQPALRRS